MTSRLILSYVEREGGREAVRALLERTGLEGCEAQLRDEDRWFSFETKVALFEAAGAVLGSDRVAERVGRAALDFDMGAGLKRVLRALGTPGMVYRNVVRANGKFNWTHRMTLAGIGDGWARIRYEDVSGIGANRHDCDYNVGLLAVVPELFGLPAARIAHPACALRGDPACLYEVRWAERARGATWAPALSAAGAAAAGAAGLAGAAVAAPVAVALAAAATALSARTAVLRSRGERDRARRLADRDAAADRLAASLRDLGGDPRTGAVLETVARNAQAAVGGRDFALLLAADGMRCERSSGVSEAARATLEAWARESPALLDPSRPAVIVDDVRDVPALAALAGDRETPLASLCAAPLRSGGQALGVLLALSRAPCAFLPHDGELLATYAAQAAIALSHATLAERLDRLAHCDPVTGLANGRRFRRALAAQVGRAERTGEAVGVVLLELDPLDGAGDDHDGSGHSDDVLRATAERLRAAAGDAGPLARLEGGEFAVAAGGCDGFDGAAAFRLAERLRAAVASVRLPGATLSCSAGVAAFPDDGRDAAGLLRAASTGLAEARAAGRDRARRFDRTAPAARARDDRARRRAALRDVLEQPGALEVHFQPVVALTTGRVVGYEALARFPTLPDGRPDRVFAAARELGVGPELEAHAIRSALAAPGRPSEVTLAVNASLSALASPNLWAALPDDLSGVIVEITEHELYESDEQLGRNLARLRERGARIAVDDAGAGYAGLQQLVRVRPDVVKLDRSLVDGVASDPAKAAMIAALTDFARSTGASVCAEGVERFDDLQLLAALDVNTAQGFLLARPGPGWPEVPPEIASLAAGRAAGGVRQVGAPVRRRGEGALDERIDALERLVGRGDAAGAVRLLARAADAEHVRLFALDEDGAAAHEVGREEPVPLGEWPACRGVLESGAAGQLLAHDPLADPSEVGRLRAAGYGAALLVPIVAGGEAVGVVEALRRAERAWHREDADRLRVLARQLTPLVGGGHAAAAGVA